MWYDFDMTLYDAIPASAYSGVTGDIDRPLSGELVVPEVVELHDDEERLWWAAPLTTRKNPRRLLEGFLELGEASSQRIRDYARQWGVLGICQHGLPYTHNGNVGTPQNRTTADVILGMCAARHGLLKRRSLQRFLQDAGDALNAFQSDGLPCRPLGLRRDPQDDIPPDAMAWEPISAWRMFARHARALLYIADSLKQRTLPAPELWEIVFEASGKAAPWWDRNVKGRGAVQGAVDVERLILARCLNEWLDLGAVRPAVTWHAGQKQQMEINFAGPRLFSALALQLVFAIGGGEAIATCSGCGQVYPARRLPRKGQRNYCQPCRRRKVPLRDAKRAQRARRENPSAKVS